MRDDRRPPDTPTSAAGPRGGPAQRKAAQRPGPEALIGQVLSGRYRIDRLLGEGGMGAVYEAEHTHMRKRMAVKVLHQEMSHLPEVVARFEREAMAAAHIDHPNVAGATDFGMLEDGSFFLALEYVEGVSLRDVVAKGRLELGRALHITNQIAQALLRAHALGIVHRDLKPENVMLVERDGDPDFVKVLDFGIAKVPVGELSNEEPAASAASGAPKILTQMGMVYGTPEYMAPEQAMGQVVDARADLYAVGVMLYEMLSGTRPFDHESKVSLLGMHVTARVPPFAERSPEALVPPEVEGIVMRLMRKEASERFETARELIEAIGNVVVLLVERGRIEPPPGIMPVHSGPQASSPGLNPASARLAGPVSLHSPGAMRSSYASAPAKVNDESGGIRVGIPSNKGRNATIAGAAVMVLSIVALVTVVSNRAHLRTGAAMASDGGAGTPSSDVSAKEAPSSVNDDKIAAALASIDKGDYGTGIATLTTLEPEEIGRADVHRALLKAYLATGASTEAMREVGLLVKTDPAAASDPKLLEDVRNAAIGKGEAADEAFALLESSLGALGIDELYEIAYEQWAVAGYPAASARARKALVRPEVRSKGSPAVQVALDLRGTSACGKLHDLLARAGDVGDIKALAILKAYLPTRGCGFLGARDCWPCMRKDNALAVAIKAIEDRDAAKKR